MGSQSRARRKKTITHYSVQKHTFNSIVGLCHNLGFEYGGEDVPYISGGQPELREATHIIENPYNDPLKPDSKDRGELEVHIQIPIGRLALHATWAARLTTQDDVVENFYELQNRGIITRRIVAHNYRSFQPVCDDGALELEQILGKVITALHEQPGPTNYQAVPYVNEISA